MITPVHHYFYVVNLTLPSKFGPHAVFQTPPTHTHSQAALEAAADAIGGSGITPPTTTAAAATRDGEGGVGVGQEAEGVSDESITGAAEAGGGEGREGEKKSERAMQLVRLIGYFYCSTYMRVVVFSHASVKTPRVFFFQRDLSVSSSPGGGGEGTDTIDTRRHLMFEPSRRLSTTRS